MAIGEVIVLGAFKVQAGGRAVSLSRLPFSSTYFSHLLTPSLLSHQSILHSPIPPPSFTMYKSITTLALLSTALAVPHIEERQATDGDSFTAAANQLISAYLPASILPGLSSRISSAAAAASVTGDVGQLIHSAFLDQGLPDWFKSAVPSAWSSNIAALESGIDSLRGTVGLVPFVVAVPTVDAQGSTITNQVTTFVPPTAT